jgi:hypothetical protein
MIFLYLFLAWLLWILGMPIINAILRKTGTLSGEKTARKPELIVNLWGLICVGLAIGVMFTSCSDNTAEQAYFEEIAAFRTEQNDHFADTASSPLTAKGLAHFNGLEFFPVDPDYKVEARFVLNPDPEIFEMQTTTERKPLYVKYGEAHFSLKGEDLVLEIYRSESAKKIKEFSEHLFLPFKDLTNGNESYGGGRFIDLKIPEGESIIIDFNKAYNPYCAYNHKYSCPIPPEANHLNIAIPAGVKAYEDHE